MADDEIERLLREVQASGSGSSTPATAPGKAAVPQEAAPSGGGRLAFAGISAVVLGVGGWVFGVFTPFTSATGIGAGAAAGAFLTALVAGPPRWFSR